MDIKEFYKNFPYSEDIPPALIKLFEYANQVETYFSGYFEIVTNGKESAKCWFSKDDEAANKFIVFGENTDNSLYGFWLYGNSKISEAPIVFLGYEGTDNSVLANNIEEFLALLGIGYEELGYADYWQEPEEEATAELQNFRAWLKQEFGIIPPPTGEAIIENAKSQHPDLDNWIKQWQETRFGK
ncbi:MAG TPA: hypothetical protein VK203_11010 [Nostocaceae cyanobacterium]|nr:hypothetical protein [Nostocaceae cyanobacterium]